MSSQFSTANPPSKNDVFEAIRQRNSDSLDSVDVTLLFPTVRVDITLARLSELISDGRVVKVEHGIRNHYKIVSNAD
jgi:hypothetical protein